MQPLQLLIDLGHDCGPTVHLLPSASICGSDFSAPPPKHQQGQRNRYRLRNRYAMWRYRRSSDTPPARRPPAPANPRHHQLLDVGLQDFVQPPRQRPLLQAHVPVPRDPSQHFDQRPRGSSPPRASGAGSGRHAPMMPMRGITDLQRPTGRVPGALRWRDTGPRVRRRATRREKSGRPPVPPEVGPGLRTTAPGRGRTEFEVPTWG